MILTYILRPGVVPSNFTIFRTMAASAKGGGGGGKKGQVSKKKVKNYFAYEPSTASFSFAYAAYAHVYVCN